MDGEIMSQKESEQYIVTIRCKVCGERFVLKGKARKGKIETGFKSCLCDNESDFEIKNERI
jgi:DNA-directed RNA polymerase subunit RPC12/RpoP